MRVLPLLQPHESGVGISLWIEVGSGPVNESDIQGAVAWIDNYCRDNPLDSVAKAAHELILAIQAK